MHLYLILHNVRSVHNVGAIFRTADCAGIKKIFLTGYTPGPLDIFGKIKNDFKKTALGAEEYIEWEKTKNIAFLIKHLKKEKIQIVALEQSDTSVDIRKFKPRVHSALILGNEVGGIPNSVLRICDKILEIPVLGKKESLNVSVAAGIALYAFLLNLKIK